MKYGQLGKKVQVVMQLHWTFENGEWLQNL